MTTLVRRSSAALMAAAVLMALVPVTAASATSEHRRTVIYAGGGVQVHLGQESRLVGTSPAFRSFVHQRLLKLWHATGGADRCRPAATVIVKSWMSAGFARVGEGVYDPCPGGGYNQLYLVRDGRWTAPLALGSQEVRSCSLMRWFGIPRPVADRQCYTDQGQLVRYRTYRLPAGYSTAGYAARVLAGSIEDRAGFADAWAAPRVIRRLNAMRDAGATTFAVGRCFGSGDATYGSTLGDARRGCQLDVGYPGHTASYVLRLDPARFGRWSTRSLQAVSAA